MKKILLILIPITLAIIAGVVTFIIFNNFGGRSTNPIKILRQAISNHDKEKFHEIVEIDAILDSAAKEILTAQINSNVDVLAYSTKDYVNTYEKLKPDFEDSAKIYIDEYISTGKITFQENLTPAQ